MHQRVMIGVAVAEDGALTPVGGVPGDGARPVGLCGRVDHAMRHIDAVVRDDDVVASAVKYPP